MPSTRHLALSFLVPVNWAVKHLTELQMAAARLWWAADVLSNSNFSTDKGVLCISRLNQLLQSKFSQEEEGPLRPLHLDTLLYFITRYKLLSYMLISTKFARYSETIRMQKGSPFPHLYYWIPAFLLGVGLKNRTCQMMILITANWWQEFNWQFL